MGTIRRSALVLMLLAVTGMVLLGVPTAHADGAVTFADNQPLVIDLTKCPCNDTSVDVVDSAVNGSTVNVTLSIEGRAAAYLTEYAFPTAVSPGTGPVPVPIKVNGNAVASTGTLVLTGDDGSLDREPVELAGASKAPSGALVPGTFDTLTVHATAKVPSYLRLPQGASGWPGILIIIGVIIACAAATRFYLKWRDTKPAWRTGALAFTAIGAAIATAVLLGALIASHAGSGNGSTLTVPSWTLSPAAPGTIEASLTGDNGQTGSLVARGANLSIENIRYAGTYNGTINTQPAGANGTIKATLFVRDGWWYAFITVTLGVALGAALSWFYLNRPLRKFRADKAAAAAAIARHESAWSRHSAGQAWDRPYTLADYAPGAIAKITAKADSDTAAATADLQALCALDASMEDLRQQVAALAAQRAAMLAHYAPVISDRPVMNGPGWLAPLQDPLNLAGQLADAQASVDARASAASGVAGVADKAEELGAQLDSLRQHIPQQGQRRDRWVQLIEDVLSAGGKDDQNPQATLSSIEDRIEALEQEVTPVPETVQEDAAAPASPGSSRLSAVRWRAGGRVTVIPAEVVLNDAPGLNRDTLLKVTVHAPDLAAGRIVHWVFSDDTESAPFPAPPPGDGNSTELSILHSFASGPQQAYANVADDRGTAVAEAWQASVGSYSEAQRLSTRLRADDRVVAAVAGVLAIGSGMQALYLNAPAWGSAGDYITALLWGAVTAEGVKLIVNIARGQWPITS